MSDHAVIPAPLSKFRIWLSATFAIAALPFAIVLWMLLHAVNFQAAEAFDAVVLKWIPSSMNGPIGMFMAFTAPFIWAVVTLVGWKIYGKQGRIALISLPVVLLPFIAISFVLIGCARAGVCL